MILLLYQTKMGGSPIYAHAYSGSFEKFWGVTARMGTNGHGQEWKKFGTNGNKKLSKLPINVILY